MFEKLRKLLFPKGESHHPRYSVVVRGALAALVRGALTLIACAFGALGVALLFLAWCALGGLDQFENWCGV